MKEIDAGVRKDYGLQGGSVYVGLGGVALAEMRIAEVLSRTNIASPYEDMTAELMLAKAQRDGKGPGAMKASASATWRASLGHLAIAAALHQRAGQTKEAKAAAQSLESYLPEVHGIPTSQCEVLYGRAGYLYALLVTRAYLGKDAIQDATVRDVVGQIIREGCETAAAHPELRKFGLMYKWHDSYYLGAAHGLVGILHMLLLSWPDTVAVLGGQDETVSLMQQAIGALLEERFPSGNLKSSIGKGQDRLVQWCHGAPGLILLLAKYQEVVLGGQPDPAITQAAEKAGDEVYKRGLLKKGVGLCHGISGNGYALLALHRMTGNPMRLRQAQQFGQEAARHYLELMQVPERGLSLYEGLAGAVCFWMDLMDPPAARFPGYDL